MLRLLISYVALLLAFGTRAAEAPLFDPDGLSLTLGGNGTIRTKSSTASVYGVNAVLSQSGTLGLPFQIGVRQTFEYHDNKGTDDVTLFSTKVFYDVIFLKFLKRLDLAAGANFGAYYGNTPLLWQAGPEFGLRYWISPTAAVVGRVDYPFDLNRGRPLHLLNYFIGLQVDLESHKNK